MKNLITCLALITCSLMGFTAQAETIQIPVGQQTEGKWQIDRPIKGMNQEQVEAIFGKPNKQNAAAGTPPISSWIYTDYTVYFESGFVIHTVLKHSPALPSSEGNDNQTDASMEN